MVKFLAATAVYLLPSLTVAGDELRSIIKKIREAEDRYKNAEVRLTTTFQNHADGIKLKPIPGEVLNSYEEVLFVRQDGMIRRELTGFSEDSKRGKTLSNDIVSYDGKFTRSLHRLKEASIRKGEPLRPLGYIPYSHFFDPNSLPPTLSDVIDSEKLNDYCLKYEPVLFRDGLLKVILTPDSVTINGLTCRKLQIVFSQKSWGDLFLAVDKGYLPARFEMYNSGESPRIPIKIVATKTFTEAAPDLWYPELVETRHYYPLRVSEAGVPLTRSTETTTITFISLTPQRDKKFFEEVAIPPGVEVKQLP